MAPLRIRYQTIELGVLDLHVRTLRDKQQYRDEGGVAQRLGIGSASWPLFGVVWDSGRVLAHLMLDYDVGGRRVLEVGCGIGLASLVLNHREVDITATDHHPDAAGFLEDNVMLNGGPEIPFVRQGWTDGVSEMSEFDLIIGSDLLYDRDHFAELSAFIDRHARPACEVIIVDPGRRQRGRFERAMRGLGYADSRHDAKALGELEAPFPGQILRYLR